MGLGSWIRGIFGEAQGVQQPDFEQSRADQPITLSISSQYHECLEVAGTTTFAKDAVAALVDRQEVGERGYYEGQAQLQREPDNLVDAKAVAVLVEGEKVGCLPSYVARELLLPIGASGAVVYQLHVLRGKKFMAKAYVWLGEGEPQWVYSQDNPPALSSTERNNSSHVARSTMVREALQGGGERAQQFKRGMVDGVHYLELVEPIKQLKREARHEEALVLCYQAIQAAEQDTGGREPAPWYTEQAAIVHRKLGDRDKEIEILRRWLARCPGSRRAGSKIAERLAKLEAK